MTRMNSKKRSEVRCDLRMGGALGETYCFLLDVLCLVYMSLLHTIVKQVVSPPAMSVMGIAEERQMDILSVVAAILHMGNISFVEQNNAATIADEACKSSVLIIVDIEIHIASVIQ